MTTNLLAIGTGKGLFLATSSDDRRTWEVTGPHFPMTGVYAVAIDTRREPARILAGVDSSHFGPTVATSDDLGATWHEPDQRPIAFPDDTKTALVRVWQLTPASAAESDVVYAGAEPQGLFRSTDGGITYDFVRPLWEHPHRPEWGAGFGGPAVHTIVPHASDPARMVIAMSTGGVYATTDGGGSWEPRNTGIRAVYAPNEYPEFGQCIHKVSASPSRPEQLFAQVHHGVYRSDDAGVTWTSIADGLPSDFGFAMVCHPTKPGVIYNFPLEADSRRYPPQARCRVYRSEDAGHSWAPLSEGLPSEPFYPSVLRDAMCADNADTVGVYFGTRDGDVYASPDEGEHWRLVVQHLPEVLCVRAAVV